MTSKKTLEKIKWYEENFENIRDSIEGKSELSLESFLKIRNFKLNNISMATEEDVKNITKKAFEKAKNDNIEEAINILRKIHGVETAVASTILAMRFPDDFAIIDRRVIEELNFEGEQILNNITEQEKKNFENYYKISSKIYEKYLYIIRDRCKKQGKELRLIEFELFKKNKERSSKSKDKKK
jgi:hypothetical protein